MSSLATDSQSIGKEAALTQAERSAASDRAMLDAAIDLVLEHGTDKTTLAMIGERAGKSRGLATYRFGSKGGLYDALCKSISRDWLACLTERVGDKVGIDAMCTALDAIHDFVTRSPREGRVLQILHAGAASPSSEFRQTSIDIHGRQQSDVADWVRRGQAEGSIRNDVDANAVAGQYIAYITGMTHLWLVSPDTFDFKSANAEMKRQLRESLAVQGAKQ